MVHLTVLKMRWLCQRFSNWVEYQQIISLPWITNDEVTGLMQAICLVCHSELKTQLLMLQEG